mmetsp:Transcript_15415/g.38215  ORF Transcript_15415/g.38215 Transcript_15415/m.38215 type:complete len:380 (-) Transcript_15415:429-1568(-)|eukprot:CAMPEP_0178996006 /NCGR_PEP_ID=MMETSP0795-20121207/8128_1 /TAXON_ID=88552 /ORGANISM="Amoebophrya sp., Strain Ameob2" /LENGTH=379 /DNA_ID=CAMNT_0020688347 /DNA_START=842 /DNA_END=1981 /DNA_ORIENTATION=-
MTSTEHQEYIQKKVNPILESLVTAILLDKPDDSVGFMVSWLSSKAAGGGAEADNLRLRINALKQEIADLENKVALADESEDNDDDVVDDLPPPPTKKGPRGSVSAEAYGAWNKKKEFIPTEIPKSDEAKARIRQVLQGSFLFSTLEPSELEIVVMAMEERRPAAGERVIQQNDDGDCLYVIEEGVFECKIRQGGEDVVVKTCEPGDAFGELALLYNCPRAASVDSTGNAILWKLDRATFNAIVKDAASKKREKYMSFLQGVQIIKDLGEYEVSQLADALKPSTVPANTNVVTQGESGDTFYLVEEGALYAWKGNSPDISLLEYGPGQFFGELALLRNDLRQANVTTRSETKVLSVDRKTFSRLLGPLQQILEKNASANY